MRGFVPNRTRRRRGRLPGTASAGWRPGFERLDGRICLAAGGLDPSFGNTGKVLGSFAANSRETALSTVVDSQNRTLVAGSVDFGMGADFAVFRFLADGTPDTTFAANGTRFVSFNLGGGNVDTACSIAIDAMDRIVVAGVADTAKNGSDIAVCRLTSAGMLDQSFDGDGRATFGFDLGGSNDDVCAGMVIDQSGRIVVAATVFQSGLIETAFGVARLDASGHIDPSFDVDGKAVFQFTFGMVPLVSAIASDSVGRLIVTGMLFPNGGQGTKATYGSAVMRLLSTGEPDPSFGVLGRRVMVPKRPANAFFVDHVVVDAADRLVLVGTRGKRLGVARWKADGKPDATFGVAGNVTVPFAFAAGTPGSVLPAYAGGHLRAAIDVSGRVVVAATVIAAPATRDVGVFRLTSTGRLDTSFDLDGRKTVAFNAGGNNEDTSGGVAVDAQGRIVVAATASRSLGAGDADVGVARLLG